MKKKEKWGSIRYKQANNIYSAEIKNQIKGALRPRACTGLTVCMTFLRHPLHRVKVKQVTVNIAGKQHHCFHYQDA